jgi:hypothetical protein
MGVDQRLPLRDFHVLAARHEANAAAENLAHMLKFLFVARTVDHQVRVGQVELLKLDQRCLGLGQPMLFSPPFEYDLSGIRWGQV